MTLSPSPNAPIDLEVLYGQTPTPTETPSLIEESMAKFHWLLESYESGTTHDFDSDSDSSSNNKPCCNWRLAEERCPHECRDEFKLMFLRSEVFRVKFAVKRYIKYWNNRVEVFGPDKAFKPMMDRGPKGATHGVHPKELKYIQFNGKDPDGRAVVNIDGMLLDTPDPDITVEGLTRASWYRVHAGLLASESAQRKGFVVVYRSIQSCKRLIKYGGVAASMVGALPVRLAAVHILKPPLLMSVLMTLVRRCIGKRLSKRVYLHGGGSHEKHFESLSNYELGREHLPKELGGEFVSEEEKPVVVSTLLEQPQ